MSVSYAWRVGGGRQDFVSFKWCYCFLSFAVLDNIFKSICFWGSLTNEKSCFNVLWMGCHLHILGFKIILCFRQGSLSYCLWWCHHCICHQEFSTESTLLKILVHQVNRNVLCIFLLGWSISPFPSTSKYSFGNIYFPFFR